MPILEQYINKLNKQSKIQELFSKIPTDYKNQTGIRREMAMLRAAIMAEYDATNFYEQLAAETTLEDVRKVMLHVANEEKAHVGEFKALLEKLDQEHEPNEEKGEDEVEELTGKDY